MTLQQIADDAWADWVEHSIQLRLKLGLPIEHLPDPTIAEAERDAAFARTVLQRLDAIEPADEEERLTAAVLRSEAQRVVEDVALFWHRFRVTPYATPLFTVSITLSEMPLDSAGRYEGLLEQMPRFIGGLASVLREQQRRGILLPKDEIPTVRRLLQNFAKPGEANPFARSEASFGATIDRTVVPAIEELLALLDDDYVAAAPPSVGLSHQPGGAEAYREFVRQETTTDLAPEEIHEIGLREMARIGRELDVVRQEAGFDGTLEDFRRFLKTDPRFFAATPEEFAERLLAHVRRIEPQVPRFFAKTPRAPYDVRRLDPNFEDGDTFGYYQVPTAAEPVGRYYFNGSKLDERNLVSAAALIAHELIPGHHFQLARQEESPSLHPIRRNLTYTAHAEGWGEYAAHLGGEMGLYDDPYDRAGRLMADAMLSARLVVDTGMNALGWSRQRASDFLREHTMLSDTEIATETLRYAADIPAQALAYKIGSMKMIELRALAERELGPRFDVREFHEWLIGSGSLPLDVLEERVRRAIASRRTGA